MDTKICTFVNTIDLDAEIQKIIKLCDNRGDWKKSQIISVIRSSEFKHTISKGDCADYIILYK